ncbi:unnamed protein product, partial [Laminaria digitata]
MRSFVKVLGFGLLATLVACNPPISEDEALLASLPETVDFNYHIRPILSDRCYKCHGPDENTRETELRLDTEEGAFSQLTESPRGRAIVAGSLRRSEVAHRIVSEDPDYAMPPPESNLKLTAYETGLIRKWIDQGAEWKEHWAFIPPEKPGLPVVTVEDWPKNEIDYFILSKLESKNIQPSEEADQERLFRRLHLDLTGLPPSVQDIDAFLADTSEDAYEKVVDKLLGTTAYAERMAVDWMDIARYADSHGYHADGYRMMWPWRDWVIKAFDENMSYDEFIKLQLAGDLLPDATAEQKLATAFHRNHQMTGEGGIVDEEYRLEYVADRTNTTARAFMGLTMECARCHDHKFDPVTQKEYYQMSAFFNNVNEVGMTGNDGNAGPMLLLFEGDEEMQYEALQDSISALADLIEQRKRVVAERVKNEAGEVSLSLEKGLVAHYPMDKSTEKTTPNNVRGAEDATLSGEIEFVDGVIGNAVKLDYDFDFLTLQKAGLFERFDHFSYALWANPAKAENYAALFSNADSKDSYWRGHEVFLDSLSRVHARLTHALPDNRIHVRTKAGIQLNEWSHVALTYDGSSKASGVALYINGTKQDAEVLFDKLYKGIHPVNGRFELNERSLRLGKSYRGFSGENGIFAGMMDEVRIYDRTLSDYEVASLGSNTTVNNTAVLKAAHRIQNAPEVLKMETTLRQLRKKAHDLIEPVEEIMVMEDM